MERTIEFKGVPFTKQDVEKLLTKFNTPTIFDGVLRITANRAKYRFAPNTPTSFIFGPDFPNYEWDQQAVDQLISDLLTAKREMGWM